MSAKNQNSMFNFYNKYILPKLLNRDMGLTDFNKMRSEAIIHAQGIVLEIGFGSGYNLPFYKNIKNLYALDPSNELFSYAKDRISSIQFPIKHLQCSAENIPLEDGSVDTVVSTWSLCSIPDLPKALNEIKRVLKLNGKFIFIEHGQSPIKINSVIQKTITPITKFFTGNCHLDRKIDDFIKESGLYIEKIDTFQEKDKPLMFSYKGIAVKNNIKL